LDRKESPKTASIVQEQCRAVEHKWPAKYLKILTEELDPTIVCLQETNVKPEQQTLFGGHGLFQNSSRRTSKAWSCNIGKGGHQGRKTRIEDEIEIGGCKKQNKKPDQETD
jgi:hypothetical protein